MRQKISSDDSSKQSLKIFSWNVNGLRAVLRKEALQEFISEKKPDILCLQEIKCKPGQVDYVFPGYKVFWNPAERAGYSGTAILVREGLLGAYVFERVNQNIYASKSDNNSSVNTAVSEGRVLVLECEKFYLVNVYTPNSKPDLSRLKLRASEWDPWFLKCLEELEKIKPVIVCGDFNAAHEEIDIARPKTNHHSAGFTDEERRGITNYIEAGLVDTFRFLHPEEVRYTWWSHWGKARENNVGWRIDYFFVSKTLVKSLRDAEIYEMIKGSDHCPISIKMEF